MREEAPHYQWHDSYHHGRRPRWPALPLCRFTLPMRGFTLRWQIAAGDFGSIARREPCLLAELARNRAEICAVACQIPPSP